MDQAVLVRPYLLEGRNLIEALDQQEPRTHFYVRAALWLYDGDNQRWQLIIASPYYDRYGPIASYNVIQDQLAALDSGPIEMYGSAVRLQLSDITAFSITNPLLGALATVFNTGHTIQGIEVDHSIYEGILIEHAYVYRIEHPLGSSARLAQYKNVH